MKLRCALVTVFLALTVMMLPAEGTNALSVISTEWFDFIYPVESAASAAFLAEHADVMALEICRDLETEMRHRFPVYMNPGVQVANAYFSPYPSNHIVFFDITPTDGSIAGYRNSLLSIFHHELTHAISLNIRTPFWRAMSAVFGDPLSVNLLLTMPMSFLEGVTVSFESLKGEGRLNDPLTLHFLAQDKIEGQFQGWKETAGARDLYPGRKSAYLYGGAFSDWLQKTYGMEKYAELWRRGAAFNLFTSYLSVRFKQVYSISLDAAWQAFEDSVAIPAEVAVNRRGLELVSPGVYSHLASGPDVLVWFDGNRNAVYSQSSGVKPRRLFDADSNLNRLSVSPDGTLLLVSSARYGNSRIDAEVRLFDLKKGRFTGEVWSGVRDAAFTDSNESFYAIRVVMQYSDLVRINRIDPETETILYKAGNGFPVYTIYNPVNAGTGRCAFIAANGLERTLLIIGADGTDLQQINMPSRVGFVRFLQSTVSPEGVTLSFSWSNGESLYRGGHYEMSTRKLWLQSQNYSGGVFFPVLESQSGNVVYVASFSDNDRLLTLSSEDFETSVLPSPDPVPHAPNPSLESLSLDLSVGLRESRSYNPLPWFLEGLFIPLPVKTPIKSGSYSLSPGFLYITGDPTERYLLVFNPTVIIDPVFFDYSFSGLVQGQELSFNLKLNDHLKPSVGGFAAYRDLSVAADFKRTIFPGAGWKALSLSLGGASHWFAPGIETSSSPYSPAFTDVLVSTNAQVSYTALRQRKLSDFRLFVPYHSGLTADLDGWYGRIMPLDTNLSSLQCKTGVYTPLVPFSLTLSAAVSDGLYFGPDTTYTESKSSRGFEASLIRYIPVFPEYANTVYDDLAASRVAAWTAELTPFHLEIQRGVPFLPLYANRLVYVAGYRGALFDSISDGATYLDSIYTGCSLQSSALVGILTNVLIVGNVEYAWPLRAGTGNLRASLTWQIQY